VAPVAREAAPAAVVGLDAEAPEQGAALTRALRRAFAARGLSGGDEVNLSELRLALGCKPATPQCLARGGELLGARRLIYGTLRRAEGQGWALEATLLEVDGGATATATLWIADADLEPGRVDATAEAVADRLAPDTAISGRPEASSGEVAAAPPPPPEVEPFEGAEPAHEGDAEQPDGRSDGKLRWGWVKPQPRWKWAAFGSSLAVTVVFGGATLGMGVWLTSRSGGFRKKLTEAAEDSLLDDSPLNDVDPNLPMGTSLCEYARSRPTNENGEPLGMPGEVRNSSVTDVCNQGETVRNAEVATGVLTAVGAAATVAFTLVLFTHREPARTSTWRRRGLHVGLDPVRGQGLSARVGGRF
jgi:hypothetical protein